MVGLGDEAINRRLELDEGAEDTAFEAAPRELGEEAFDGFICAVLSGPKTIMPSEWLRWVWDQEQGAHRAGSNA